MGNQYEYALAILGKRIRPWRATRKEAEEDALRSRNATRDRVSNTVYVTVPADIMIRSVEQNAAQPRLRIVGGIGRH